MNISKSDKPRVPSTSPSATKSFFRDMGFVATIWVCMVAFLPASWLLAGFFVVIVLCMMR